MIQALHVVHEMMVELWTLVSIFAVVYHLGQVGKISVEIDAVVVASSNQRIISALQ